MVVGSGQWLVPGKAAWIEFQRWTGCGSERLVKYRRGSQNNLMEEDMTTKSKAQKPQEQTDPCGVTVMDIIGEMQSKYPQVLNEIVLTVRNRKLEARVAELQGEQNDN